MCSGSEEGSYPRLIELCIAQLNLNVPSQVAWSDPEQKAGCEADIVASK
jgi:hypothetical protein